MKKLLLMSLVLFSTLTVSAQYWIQGKTEADELKGTKAYSYHAIKIPEKGILILDDDKDVLKITTFEGIFNYELYDGVYAVVNGIFGMYGENGELVAKEEVMVSVSKESPRFAIADYSRSALNNSSGISKVASWIRNSKGSVRIILPRYAKTDFDVTLPTFLSQKEPNSGQSNSKSTQKKSPKKPIRRK